MSKATFWKQIETEEPTFGAGVEVTDANDDRYRYCKAASALAEGDVCQIGADDSATATKITTTNAASGRLVGVVQRAVTSGYWFFLKTRTRKPVNINVAASCAADETLSTTTTGGRLDDTDVAGNKILGLALTTARGGTAGTAPGVFTDPIVGE